MKDRKKDNRMEDILEGLNHADSVVVSGLTIELVREDLEDLFEELDSDTNCKADVRYRRCMFLLRSFQASLECSGEELVSLLHRLKKRELEELNQSEVHAA